MGTGTAGVEGRVVMSARVGLFATALLGFLYSVLSLMGGVKTDVLAGMVVALVGIIGWGVCELWEERQ